MSCPSGWDATASHCMRTRPVCCRVGDRLDGNRGAKVSFDFLGFTLHWRRARSGRWGMWCKTRSSRVQRAMTVAAAWCRRHRHLPVAVQHAALTRRIQGHFNYFGVSGNARSVGLLVDATERHWYTWLRRRSNRTRLTWPRFVALLERYPLPVPQIRTRIRGTGRGYRANNATNLGQGSTTFRMSGDMSPDVNAPVMGPFERAHQHGPPLLGRVRGPTRSPTSSLVCSPPTPALPSAAAPVVPGRWPPLSLVRQGGRRASQVPGPSSSSVP